MTTILKFKNRPEVLNSVLNALTDEPQKCGVIAKKVQLQITTVREILGVLLSQGKVVKVPHKYADYAPLWKKA